MKFHLLLLQSRSPLHGPTHKARNVSLLIPKQWKTEHMWSRTLSKNNSSCKIQMDQSRKPVRNLRYDLINNGMFQNEMCSSVWMMVSIGHTNLMLVLKSGLAATVDTDWPAHSHIWGKCLERYMEMVNGKGKRMWGKVYGKKVDGGLKIGHTSIMLVMYCDHLSL